MDETVLVYIYQDDKVLMLLRNKEKDDINKGKWIGVGGHLEKGETPLDALFREVKEETNLDVISYKYHGIVYFVNGEYEEKMHIYTVNEIKGEIKECDEGTLAFIPKKDLLSLNMWEGDKIFLELIVTSSPYFELRLTYEGDKLVKSERLK